VLLVLISRIIGRMMFSFIISLTSGFFCCIFDWGISFSCCRDIGAIKFRVAYMVVWFSCRKFAELLLSGSFSQTRVLRRFQVMCCQGFKMDGSIVYKVIQ